MDCSMGILYIHKLQCNSISLWSTRFSLNDDTYRYTFVSQAAPFYMFLKLLYLSSTAWRKHSCTIIDLPVIVARAIIIAPTPLLGFSKPVLTVYTSSFEITNPLQFLWHFCCHLSESMVWNITFCASKADVSNSNQILDTKNMLWKVPFKSQIPWHGH